MSFTSLSKLKIRIIINPTGVAKRKRIWRNGNNELENEEEDQDDDIV
jgi:hypothetical protein